MTSKEVAKELKISVSDIQVLARVFKIGLKHEPYASFKFTKKNIEWLKSILPET